MEVLSRITVDVLTTLLHFAYQLFEHTKPVLKQTQLPQYLCHFLLLHLIEPLQGIDSQQAVYIVLVEARVGSQSHFVVRPFVSFHHLRLSEQIGNRTVVLVLRVLINDLVQLVQTHLRERTPQIVFVLGYDLDRNTSSDTVKPCTLLLHCTKISVDGLELRLQGVYLLVLLLQRCEQFFLAFQQSAHFRIVGIILESGQLLLQLFDGFCILLLLLLQGFQFLAPFFYGVAKDLFLHGKFFILPSRIQMGNRIRFALGDHHQWHRQ